MRFICASTVFSFGQSSRSNLPPQGSFDHLKGSYVCGLWEDVFLNSEGSAVKSLADHLLRDDSRLGKDVPRQ